MVQQSLSEIVCERYSGVARDNVPAQYSRQVAAAFGYTEGALDSIPEGANMGLSCGNPTATAHLREGEVVVDLGSGGGLDVFLAAKQVGSTGQAIGLDFSKDMVELARRNAVKQGGFDNVRFEQVTTIAALPLADASADCIISNCVINLVPDAQKQDVIHEIFRVLKPGGRVSISDLVARQPIPDQIREDIASYVGCVSGAVEAARYREMFLHAGFPDAVLIDTKKDINVYKSAGSTSSGCCRNQKPVGGMSAELSYDVNEVVESFQIYAMKPL